MECQTVACVSVDACTGCAACAAACPASCIAMRPDFEGFFRPEIIEAQCTACGRCVKICPALDPQRALSKLERLPAPAVYAAWNLDPAIRLQSSSGGVFSVLAEHILSLGGAVVGAAFDENLAVRHILIDSAKDLPKLRGSKYVQSVLQPSLYREIRSLLDRGRLVLFSGTPCQVAGIRSYLHKSYANLFCCDLICHGVPSPLFFHKHISFIQKKNGRKMDLFSFRDKEKGWKKFKVAHRFEGNKKRLLGLFSDAYMAAFCKEFSLRPVCYACPYTTVGRGGDLTIADFWRVADRYPEYDADDKGTSLLLVNSEKGAIWLDTCRSQLFLGAADIETAIAGNPMLARPCHRPQERNTFYTDLAAEPYSTVIRTYRLRPAPIAQRLAYELKDQVKARVLTRLRRLARRLLKCS